MSERNSSARRPRIAVITPYYKETLDVLRQGYESVLNQDVEADVDHFYVADGFPNSAINLWKAYNIALPVAHGDNGSTPRAVGALLAEAGRYDFISFLDADNWFHKSHLSSLIRLHEASKACVCCSWRTFHRLDGTEMKIQEVDEQTFQHVDTSCFFIHRSAFVLNSVWSQMPSELSPISDRVFLAAARHKLGNKVAFSKQATVAFRTDYPVHYKSVNETPPPSGLAKPAKIDWAVGYLRSVNGVTKCVAQLGFWPGTYIRTMNEFSLRSALRAALADFW